MRVAAHGVYFITLVRILQIKKTPYGVFLHYGIVMQLLTSCDREERKRCFETLVSTDADCLVMHEGFHCDDPKEFTRPWFCWANTLFALAVAEMKAEGEIQ